MHNGHLEARELPRTLAQQFFNERRCSCVANCTTISFNSSACLASSSAARARKDFWRRNWTVASSSPSCAATSATTSEGREPQQPRNRPWLLQSAAAWDPPGLPAASLEEVALVPEGRRSPRGLPPHWPWWLSSGSAERRPAARCAAHAARHFAAVAHAASERLQMRHQHQTWRRQLRVSRERPQKKCNLSVVVGCGDGGHGGECWWVCAFRK